MKRQLEKLQSELRELRIEAEQEVQHKNLVRKYYDEMDRQHFDYPDSATDEGLVIHMAGRDEELDKKTSMEYMKYFYQAFPDGKHSIEELLAEGSKVLVRFTFRGTHKNEFEGIQATGKKVEYEGVEIWKIEHDKVVEIWALNDGLTMMLQLGLELQKEKAA